MNLPSAISFCSDRTLPPGFDEGRWRAVEGAQVHGTSLGTLPESVRRSSQGRPWQGLALWHQVGPEGDLYVPPTSCHSILVRRALPTALVQRHGTAIENTRWQPGQALVVPAELPTFWRSSQPRDNLHINLSPTWLHRMAAQDTWLPSCFGRDDPVLAGFAQLLLASLDSDASLNAAFGEHMAQAIALHLIEHYARQVGPRPRSGLTRRQMGVVQEAVLAEIGQSWTIERMAKLVGLSPFHFARAFKLGFGAPPQAWLRLQRMERAAELVRSSQLPLAEIAGMTGHRSAAHFAQVFGRHWGMPPSAYRRAA